MYQNIQTIILVGGRGERLKPITDSIPKVMVPIKKKPFLEYLILYLKKYNLKEIILCTGYLHDKVEEYFRDGKKFGVSIVYSREVTPLGTGGAIKNSQPLINSENFYVLNGDSYSPVDLNAFYSFHLEKSSIATISLNRVNDTSNFGSVTLSKDGVILKFTEKMGLPKRGWVNSGIYLFKKEIFTNLSEYGQAFSIEKDFFPNFKRKLYGFRTGKKIIDIGTPASFELLQEESNTLLKI